MQKLKVNDNVVVLTGKDRGKTGEVKKINFKTKVVYVGGVNLVKKAIKPTQENPAGGIVDIEAPLHISNVAVVSPKTNKATRVKIEEKDGKKVRVAVSCGSVLS
ncbi:50S ribosomal protein L24 [Halobacteriovorax sp. XZX-3]|uniref:50S ribosomal protein L24 n=1 Tax=unclassified Halobacteriovorax TaxID=2639665 RepID=UPI000CD2E8A8|nr:50S ribosomal protein L24 [Halobacteriovorax sp. DA5]POB12398.1 50S ribosomal protein L24 [Halobacteriovorax sp. DA5]